MSMHKNKAIRKKFLVFGKPAIGQGEINEVVDSLKSGWIGTGPKAIRFEEDFRKYINCRYAVALNSCTSALHIALLINNIGYGDEVITTPFTFCATANVILHVGAKPVFVDINRETFNIDVSKIEEKITKKTKAIIPVHFAGRPCEMDTIMKIAKKYNLIVIEDAAHAIESEYKGRKIGTIGDFTCFSFYVTKNLVTGEGGMITLNNKKLADKIKIYALHGMDNDAWARYSDRGFRRYRVVYPGYKYNMTDLQAGIGIQQLKQIEKYSKKRKKIWQKYNDAFKSLGVEIPREPETDTRHAYHLYTLLVDKKKVGMDRDEFQEQLYKKNIGTGIHFTSLHLEKYYREKFLYKPSDFPNAYYVSKRIISIPLSAALSQKDVNDVIVTVKMLIKGGRK